MKMAERSINELVRACAQTADPADWEEFLRRCTPVVSSVAAHIASRWTGPASSGQVLDIVQEVYLRLCERERRILREFVPKGDASFFALLRVIAASVASDFFRRQYSARRGAQHMTTGIDEYSGSVQPGPDSSDAKMHQNVLFSEIDSRMLAASDAVSTRDRAIFWLYFRQGFTAEEIAGLPVVHLTPKGVESVLRRVTQWLARSLDPSGAATRGDSSASRPEESKKIPTAREGKVANLSIFLKDAHKLLEQSAENSPSQPDAAHSLGDCIG